VAPRAATGYTYGALAAPIAFLLATFFIALAIVLGAHFNAAVAHLWPALPTDRPRTPDPVTPGQRRQQRPSAGNLS
jgi:membrane protein